MLHPYQLKRGQLYKLATAGYAYIQEENMYNLVVIIFMQLEDYLYYVLAGRGPFFESQFVSKTTFPYRFPNAELLDLDNLFQQ